MQTIAFCCLDFGLQDVLWCSFVRVEFSDQAINSVIFCVRMFGFLYELHVPKIHETLIFRPKKSTLQREYNYRYSYINRLAFFVPKNQIQSTPDIRYSQYKIRQIWSHL
jgi:hypothetical protein